MNNIPKELVQKWICPDCQAAKKKGGDNSHTPVRPQVNHDNANVTFRKKSQQQDAPTPTPQDTFVSLTSEIRLLRQEMTDLKSQISEAVSNMNKCHVRLEEVAVTLTSTETRLRTLEDQKHDCDKLKATVNQLQAQLNSQAQSLLANEVEISGVTEINNENLHHLVLVAAAKVGVEVSESDLDGIRRAGPRRTSADVSKDGRPPLPRPVVVRFTRKAKRNEFLKAAKARRSLNNKDLVDGGPEMKIFVNERLTTENRQLFRETRFTARQAGIKHVWTTNGIIYIRLQEGAAPKPIKSYMDLERLLGLGANE